MSTILATIIQMILAAFGEAAADIFKAWQADRDARALGAQEVETSNAQANAKTEAAYAQIATDGSSPAATAGRLRGGTF